MPKVTIVTCPVCGVIFDAITGYGEEEAGGQVIAMLASDGRRMHAKESPACTQDVRWFKGWDTEVKEVPNV